MRESYNFRQFSFFTEVYQLAQQTQCHDLSLGLPDFDVDERLKTFLKEASDFKHHYEPLEGNPFLIESIIEFNAKRTLPLNVNFSEVNVIPCSTFGLYASLKSLLNLGDEVVIFEPCYYTYTPSVVLNSGVPVYCELDEQFNVDWNLLESCIGEKTKAIIVNSPHNPTGKIWTEADWERLYQLIKNKNIYIICEEIYDIYTFTEAPHYSPFHHPFLREKTFSIFSFGKMFHATGWKVSYMLACEELLNRFRENQQYISYSVNAPAQQAIGNFLKIFDKNKNKTLMLENRNLVCQLLKNSSFKVEQQAEGAFYQLVNFRAVNPNMTDVEFIKWLMFEKKVACLPLSAFYHSKLNSDYIRISFTRNNDTLSKAMRVLSEIK